MAVNHNSVLKFVPMIHKIARSVTDIVGVT